MVGKSDFAPFSALNFCKDNAFFRYKETNEKTLIKKVVFGVILHRISSGVMPMSILLVASPRLNTE